MPRNNLILGLAPIILLLLFGRATYASTDETLGTWLRARFGEDAEIVSVHREHFAWAKAEVISIKFLHTQTQEPGDVTIDAAGNELVDGGNAVREEDILQRFEIVGALTDEVNAELLDMRDSDAIDVAIWLRTYEPGIDEQVASDGSATPISSSRASAVECLKHDWDYFQIDAAFEVVENAPLVYARMFKQDIYSIADSPCVSAIYFDGSDDRSLLSCPASIPGFYWESPYRATTQLDSLPSYNGTGQKVCIQELSSAASYPGLTGPSARRHRRHNTPS